MLHEEAAHNAPVWYYNVKNTVKSGHSTTVMEGKCYAVRKGRTVGLFYTWEKCRSQIHEYSGCEYKNFRNVNDVVSYLQGKN